MRVGSVAESVTVTGESPVVDVQTSQRREVVSQELLEGDSDRPQFRADGRHAPGGHDRRVRRRRLERDVGRRQPAGARLGRPAIRARSSTAWWSTRCSPAASAPASTTTKRRRRKWPCRSRGGAAENQLSGVLVNRIPKYRRQQVQRRRALALLQRAACRVRTSTMRLRARGHHHAGAAVPAVRRQLQRWAGRFMQDRLWFFVSGRNWAYNNYVANALQRRTAARRSTTTTLKAFPVRLTWQVSTEEPLDRDVRLGEQDRAATCRPGAGRRRPRRACGQEQPGEHIAQAKWTSTLTPSPAARDRLPAGRITTSCYTYQPEVVRRRPATRRSTSVAPGTGYGSIPHQDTLLGTTHRRAAGRHRRGRRAATSARPCRTCAWRRCRMCPARTRSRSDSSIASAGRRTSATDVNGDLNQRYRNGVPFAVQVLNTPSDSRSDVNADLGVFVQDTWTTQAADAEPRAAVGLLQLVDSRADRRRPAASCRQRAFAAVAEHPELEQRRRRASARRTI